MKGTRPASALLAVLALAALSALTGCGEERQTTVEVDARMTACTQGGAKCFDLGIPDATVTLVAGDGSVLTSGRTDQTGKVSLEPAQSGAMTIVLESPLILEGRKEAEAAVTMVSGNTAQWTIWASMSPEVKPPA